MKQTLAFLLAVWACCLNVGAQLVVDSVGNVGIGTEKPSYPFCVNGTGKGQAVMEVRQSGALHGLEIRSHQLPVQLDARRVTKSLYVRSFGARDKIHVGVYSVARRLPSTYPSLTSVGVMGEACTAKNNIGVYGKVPSMDTTVFLCRSIWRGKQHRFGTSSRNAMQTWNICRLFSGSS